MLPATINILLDTDIWYMKNYLQIHLHFLQKFHLPEKISNVLFMYMVLSK